MCIRDRPRTARRGPSSHASAAAAWHSAGSERAASDSDLSPWRPCSWFSFWAAHCCAGGHTCRPAAVVTPKLLENPVDARNTVGVCYPDRIVTQTATSADLPILPQEPHPDVCLTQSDCKARDVAFELCQVRVTVIPDHPSVPAGSDAWKAHLALASTCVNPISAGLTGVDKGCTKGSECESGICHDGRCARLCDASLPEPCPGGRSCKDTQVTRPIPGDGQEVRDRIWLCQGL